MVDETSEFEVRKEISRLQNVLKEIDRNNNNGRRAKYLNLYKDKWIMIYHMDSDTYEPRGEDDYTLIKVKDIECVTPVGCNTDSINFIFYPESYLEFENNELENLKYYGDRTSGYSSCIKIVSALEVHTLATKVVDWITSKFEAFNELNSEFEES